MASYIATKLLIILLSLRQDTAFERLMAASSSSINNFLGKHGRGETWRGGGLRGSDGNNDGTLMVIENSVMGVIGKNDNMN